jgi:hypothetical protein
MTTPWAGGTVLALTLTIGAYGVPRPAGEISVAEGRVTLDGHEIGAKVMGAPSVAPGQVLATGQGRAELLLNPGVFLRLAEESAVKLVSSRPDNTRAELLRGEALLEVLELGKRDHLEIINKEAYTHLLKPGLYVFHVEGPTVRVYQGKAQVEDDRRIASFSRGKQLTLNTKSMEPQKFDLTENDGLYSWSAQRTRTMAQTSESMVGNLLAFARGEKYDAGWYWNPWFQAWAFVPAEGYRLSAFGYGFYAVDAPHSMMPVFADFH